MLFAVIAIDKPNSLALRMATREAHFAYAKETGMIRLGGPFLDDNADMAGSLILFEAEDLAAARAPGTRAIPTRRPASSRSPRCGRGR